MAGKTEKKAAKARSRVSYSKDMRADARARQDGLVTISVETPDGERHEGQAIADPLRCRFARWAAAVLFCPEVRDLPDLESLVRQLMENQQ